MYTFLVDVTTMAQEFGKVSYGSLYFFFVRYLATKKNERKITALLCIYDPAKKGNN